MLSGEYMMQLSREEQCLAVRINKVCSTKFQERNSVLQESQQSFKRETVSGQDHVSRNFQERNIKFRFSLQGHGNCVEVALVVLRSSSGLRAGFPATRYGVQGSPWAETVETAGPPEVCATESTDYTPPTEFRYTPLSSTATI